MTQLKVTEWAEFGVLLPMWEITSVSDQWADVIEKLLNDKVLHTHYAEKAKERLRDFSIPNMLNAWNTII